MEPIIIDEKWDERDFLLWLLEAAPNFLIERLSSEQNYKARKKGMKDKSMTAPLRKQRIMKLLSKKNLPFKILHYVREELIVIFDWYYGVPADDDQLNTADKIAVIHQRYKDNDVDAVQELALALFMNKDFTGAYALYEQHAMPAVEQRENNATTKASQHAQKQLDDYEQRLKKYEKLEQENKALKKEKAKLTKERVEANAEARKAKKSEEEKRKENHELRELVKKLENQITSCDEAWQADKQEKIAAVGALESLQRDLNEAEQERDALKEELRELTTQPKDVPIEENLAAQLAKQMQENQLGTPTQNFTFITDKPRTTEVAAPTIAVLDKPRTGHLAILGDPKGALHSLSDAQKATIEIYDTTEMAAFIADIERYKVAIVFELRCERQAFERAAPAEVRAAVTFVKTVLELVQKLGEH